MDRRQNGGSGKRTSHLNIRATAAAAAAVAAVAAVATAAAADVVSSAYVESLG